MKANRKRFNAAFRFIFGKAKNQKMKRDSVIKISFLISVVGILIGSVLKIMHSSFAEFLLPISIVFYIVFAVLALYEIYRSPNIETTEKIMWTIGLLFLGSIVGIVYLVAGRKRIINTNRNTHSTSSLYEN